MKLFKFIVAGMAMIAPIASVVATGEARPATSSHPTIVLVHGAFAESSSWNEVIEILQTDGYNVVATSNPLRSVRTDAASVASVVKAQVGSVLLVGHSYGGTVITDAASGARNVKGLVFVAAFAPDVGETSAGLSGKFPGGTLGTSLTPPVELPDGNKDLYIHPAKFAQQFAADVPAAKAVLMAVTQRPITAAALNEPTVSAGWRSLPSWFIYGSADRNIPAAALSFMAKRAKSLKTIVIPGASHVVMVSNPKAVAALIEEAADTR